MSAIHVIGLNGALQKTCVFKRPGLVVNSVNRAASASSGIGGKGQDVCLALLSLGVPTPPTLLQFSGGYAGKVLTDMLDGAGVRCVAAETAACTRMCYTLVDTLTGETTEIVEPWGGLITKKEQNDLLEKAKELAANSAAAAGGGAAGVAVMGSSPDGVPADYTAKLLSCLCGGGEGGGGQGSGAKEVKVLVDSVSGVPHLIQTGYVGVLKVNAEELLKLRECPEDMVSSWMEDSLREAAAYMFDKWSGKLAWIAVTNGALPSFLYSCNGKRDDGGLSTFWRFFPPSLEDPFNPIGCGDAVAATTLATWLETDDMVESFKRGLAAGGASCSNRDPLCNSRFDKKTFDELVSLVRVEEVEVGGSKK